MNKNERRLLELYNELDQQGQTMLQNYAEFLRAQAGNTTSGVKAKQRPKQIPAPENETVIAALKRLSESYYMLDRSKLLDSSSMLMAQHVMQGRDAADVIKELEADFVAKYEQYCEAIGTGGSADGVDNADTKGRY